MNLAELVALFRTNADDAETPYLWSDAEVIAWFVEAEEEACVRASLIHDDRTIEMDTPSSPTLAATTGTLDDATYSYRISATNASGETLASTAATLAVVLGAGANGVTLTWTAVTGAVNYKIYGRTGGSELLIATVGESTLTYTDNDATVTPEGALPTSNTTEDVVKIDVYEGQQIYTPHESILEITYAYLLSGTTRYELEATDIKTLDNDYPTWRTSARTPTGYIYDGTTLQLNAPVAADFTLMMEVKRKPLVEMSSITAPISTPEIHVKAHRYLEKWVRHKAYDKRDVDASSEKRSKKAYKEFKDYFGPRLMVNTARDMEANRPHRVVSHW